MNDSQTSTEGSRLWNAWQKVRATEFSVSVTEHSDGWSARLQINGRLRGVYFHEDYAKVENVVNIWVTAIPWDEES